ncbi:MAG: ribosome recycling factor [Magnetococcales bacterium]|nr:ribosome recycling factor [Magnetococcales bacterium]
MNAAYEADLTERMKKVLQAMQEELGGLRTGRANTGLLDHLTIEAYGSRMPLNQVASLNVPEARMITVQPWDRSLVNIIDKAIRESDLGLNPIKDGMVLRIPLPELTEDRRRDLVKVVHKFAEQARVAIRNVRRDGVEILRKAEKNKEISKDDLHVWEKTVQELTDRHIERIGEIALKKEEEIMHV